jgi:hypothetical protein
MQSQCRCDGLPTELGEYTRGDFPQRFIRFIIKPLQLFGV